MPDFSWLNRLDEREWSPQGNGFVRAFDLNKFLAISRASPATWRDEFDIWGAEQERRYEQFPGPNARSTGDPLAWIVFGDYDGSGPAVDPEHDAPA